MENNDYKMRPMDLKHDYDELITFFDNIFEKELGAKGTSFKTLLDEYNSFLPVLKILGIFSRNFRHGFDGFVCENSKGDIVATVNIGYAGNFWEISMVATHPDHRRKGLARKLVKRAIEHAKEHKASLCVLEVLEENSSAYALYKSLGFHHFDTTHKLRLTTLNSDVGTMIDFPDDYTIKSRKEGKRIGKQMYELEKSITPAEVLQFLPVNKIKHIKPLTLRILRFFARFFIKINSERWNIYYNDKLVGMVSAKAGKVEKDSHSIEVMIDPEHQELITEQTIKCALNYINEHSKFDLITTTEIRNTEKHIRQKLEDVGFTVYETYHLLALKIAED